VRRCIRGRWLLCAALLSAALACRDRADAAIAEVVAAADSADQLMIGLSTVMTNEGVRQALLEADTAFIYENSGRVDLVTVEVTFFTTSGVQTSVLTSREGTYNMRTGAMEARGDVVMVRTDGSRLTTSVLRYDQTANEVSSDQPFVYDAPGRHIEGEAFVSDPSLRNITTRRPRGITGQFTLPGQ
jgi:LPS export ABC transporter protein LptC